MRVAQPSFADLPYHPSMRREIRHTVRVASRRSLRSRRRLARKRGILRVHGHLVEEGVDQAGAGATGRASHPRNPRFWTAAVASRFAPSRTTASPSPRSAPARSRSGGPAPRCRSARPSSPRCAGCWPRGLLGEQVLAVGVRYRQRLERVDVERCPGPSAPFDASGRCCAHPDRGVPLSGQRRRIGRLV